jgi:hypothetical protein
MPCSTATLARDVSRPRWVVRLVRTEFDNLKSKRRHREVPLEVFNCRDGETVAVLMATLPMNAARAQETP